MRSFAIQECEDDSSIDGMDSDIDEHATEKHPKCDDESDSSSDSDSCKYV